MVNSLVQSPGYKIQSLGSFLDTSFDDRLTPDYLMMPGLSRIFWFIELGN